jgi:hypothetical protein
MSNVAPLTCPQVDIGVTYPRPSDPHDHVVRALPARLGNLLDSQRSMEGVQNGCLHWLSWSGVRGNPDP